MQNDREHLDTDLGFLDEAKPRDAQAQTASKYKVNQRNIAIAGGLIVVFLIWIGSYNTSNQGSAPTSYAPPAADNAPSVNSGQFRCSSYDSSQADLMAPKNEFELNEEEEALTRRSDALDSLKKEIATSGVTPHSDQPSIDRYNAMISQYDAELTSIKADYSSHQTRIDIYNQQIRARNDYLLKHCRRGR